MYSNSLFFICTAQTILSGAQQSLGPPQLPVVMYANFQCRFRSGPQRMCLPRPFGQTASFRHVFRTSSVVLPDLFVSRSCHMGERAATSASESSTVCLSAHTPEGSHGRTVIARFVSWPTTALHAFCRTAFTLANSAPVV